MNKILDENVKCGLLSSIVQALQLTQVWVMVQGGGDTNR